VRVGSVQVALVYSVLCAALASSGCAPIAPAPQSAPASNESADALKTEVARLTEELTALRTTLGEVRTEQQAVTTELDLQNRALGRVEGAVAMLPDAMKQACPPPARAETRCKEPETRRVVVSGSKMVVGDVEQIWIDPPGVPLDAHIDTNASNNSLLGESIVEFERDGKSWVRFALHSRDADEPVLLERRVSRHVRSVQAGGTEIKRPMVSMRIRLGDVQDTFWFVLTDRADHPVVLGRSFLKDIALVDVGARYVQPRAAAPAPPDDKPTP